MSSPSPVAAGLSSPASRRARPSCPASGRLAQAGDQAGDQEGDGQNCRGISAGAGQGGHSHCAVRGGVGDPSSLSYVNQPDTHIPGRALSRALEPQFHSRGAERSQEEAPSEGRAAGTPPTAAVREVRLRTEALDLLEKYREWGLFLPRPGVSNSPSAAERWLGRPCKERDGNGARGRALADPVTLEASSRVPTPARASP